MKKENYFTNKEPCLSHFYENLKKITSQSLIGNKLQIKQQFWKMVKYYLSKKVQSH